ncbi:lipase family protein [Actinokineospora sp. HUAS TT18]|uniref:lipase family protein n=1 Tax=Actinokineospora sp. HUAS TT18 TaxID=3447451 RepID=UPI003F520373
MRARISRSKVAAVALALVAAVAPVAQAQPVAPVKAAQPVPADDAFYIPPSPLPAGAPGDIIRSRVSKSGQFSDTVNSWQVMYLSTDEHDRPNAVTGTILVPKNVNPATAPIVSFAVGTHGGAFRCTPSNMISIGALYERPAVADMLKAGYAVAVTDYAGYHPNPKTTYITGRSEGHAVIDVVRAGQKLDKLSKTSKVFFRGYSQGGGAALWGAQLQPSYGTDVNLAGVVAGGVPGDLVLVTLGLDGSRGFGFLLYALIGLDNAYPEIKLASYLNDAGRAAVADLQESSCTLELLVKYKGKSLSDFTVDTPVQDPLLAAVAQNKLGGMPVKVPVMQYHGASDDIVALGQADTLHKTYCRAGVNLFWKTYPVDHITGIYQGNADAMTFLKDRVAGTPAVSNC